MTFKGIAKKRTLAFVITLCVCFSTWMVVPANAVTFNDVKTTDASYTAITWAVENGITNGVSEGVFAPQATCNNGQIITYLWRALGKQPSASANPFPNISPANYYYDAVLWAYEKGILDGTAFDAGAPCTRLATVNYLWRAAGSPEPHSSATFNDVSVNSKAISWAVEQGITNGFAGGEFRPSATCTRSQIIMFLYRDLVTAGSTAFPAQSQLPADLPENGKYQITTAEGTYEYDVKDGKISATSWVRFLSNDGTDYFGQMVGNKFSGQCYITYGNGDTYSGAVSQNLKSGSGNYAWANGDSYSGQWANDKMNGQGTYSFAAGGRLSGAFVNDVPNGTCVYQDVSGNTYTTTWENGTRVSMVRS
jgi:hypothetical protein